MRSWALPLLSLISLALMAQEPLVLNDAAVLNGLRIPVELSKGIKVNHARPGDVVHFRMAEAILVGKGVVVPRDAKLFGKVLYAGVAAKGKNSFLSFVVDRAEWKGHSLPLNAFVTGWGTVKRVEVTQACAPSMPQAPQRRRGPMAPTMGGGSGGFGPDCAENQTLRTQTFGIRGVDIYRENDTGVTIMVSKKDIHLPGGMLLLLQNVPPPDLTAKK